MNSRVRVLAKRRLKELGFSIVRLSDRLGEFVHYDSESPTSYAMGATLVYDLMRFRPEMVMHVIAINDERPERYHDETLQMAREHGVPITFANDQLMWNGRRLKHSIIAEFVKWEDELRPGSHVVIVEPALMGNVGAIIRTALAFDIHDVAIIKEGLDTFSPSLVRGSMGARLGLHVEAFSSFEEYRERFGENHIYPFMLDGAVGLSDVEKIAPFSLVFGNETVGLPAEYAGYGQPVFIEQGEDVDSLNVATSAALGIYAFTRACPMEAD